MPQGLLPTISNLRDVPAFLDAYAERAWTAWWTDSDVTLDEYRARLQDVLAGGAVPAAWVAHLEDVFVGAVLLIESDVSDRPQYAPWIAALWVEPAHRRQGIAKRLQDAASLGAKEAGFDTVYLCANPENTPYYLGLGYTLIENNVEGLNIFSRPAGVPITE